MTQAQYLRPKRAAAFLKNKFDFGSASSLAKLRCFGGGPPFVKIGTKDVAYEISSLEAWATAKISPPLTSTSEAAERKRVASDVGA